MTSAVPVFVCGCEPDSVSAEGKVYSVSAGEKVVEKVCFRLSQQLSLRQCFRETVFPRKRKLLRKLFPAKETVFPRQRKSPTLPHMARVRSAEWPRKRKSCDIRRACSRSRHCRCRALVFDAVSTKFTVHNNFALENTRRVWGWDSGRVSLALW